MATKVGINGFGRIGRMVARAILERNSKNIELVAVNDITDAKSLAHLLKYDSVHGRFPGDVKAGEGVIVVNGKEIKVLSKRDHCELPWKDLGVEIVVESTGLFTIKNDGVNKKGKEVKGAVNHISKGGAKKVIISAPAQGEDLTVVLGVNDDKYDPKNHNVVSNASCTTNCLGPVAKVINDKWGIEKGLMTAIHAYTNDQHLQDLPHSDMRRARAAAVSMIPTSTGAAKAIALVIPELKGKLDGFAMRVPVINVSVVDLSCTLKKEATVEDINKALKEAAEGRLKGILDYTSEDVVSVDFNHSSVSSTVDSKMTKVIGGNFLKVLAWYDNEWGYSCRVVDLIELMIKKGL
ncbi:MAG: type I glyceraldehyde-3-phosphate dehydrogenase [Candidatus Omnitrophica bacterium CG12_big_fil_rev_8_21_14_0_65_43_15]|uniref:Glyceraldehyde-3-phosphate dehydrogenase n=1 Tax=Candidatus Taenaricola geysiri TaxID=1974752 RepID=A0A2J0LES4_9BACT|nr:MAG: type I glyceraldehyde-3-phosphate dehydrogenase [Candidatus Omnitrophica bacterium CG1_02_43_210]PIW66358.1 MAG: type I glyceraldehyde-3-phosphate dehydrogenase [Candidatus Omnitrophica bacterium CG12_big_fil_rev_8_21_14_0_65_43_15]PIW80958.1 MAG: type I glyceraldehyde-3-phosphate dehydrogenase [Candidatus Omnitrophica bacterium CG_4_8_14_3_um_filter_43_15]PIY83351.1 MAG: type I glyceraldehyde-3-phosphate dehydrogenase [Candidatus Omnitrophica bacterium CG_4_10_14_0_8_um_filter_43_18]